MNLDPVAKRAACAFLAILALSLAGCGGPKVLLRDAHPPEGGSPLLEASDSRIAVTLDAVVARGGAGSWASEAHWDEYHLRVRSLSGDDVRLVRITLFDALGHAVESSFDRGGLIDGSRAIEKRYEDSGEMARSGSGGAWTLLAGGVAASAAGGAGLGAASAAGSGFAGVAAAGGALTVGAVFLVGAAAVKVMNNVQVGTELARRQTPLPAKLGTADSRMVAFFPIVSLPSALELAYIEGGVEQRVRAATQTALSQVHAPRVVEIIRRPEPLFPPEARRRRIDKGTVSALVTIDANGDVSGVDIIQASTPEFVDEAKNTFRTYKYNPGIDGRTAEEVMRFKRGAGS